MATTIAGLSEKQKLLRATGLGASEVPTALGMNPFKSAAELADEKRGILPPFEGNRFTHWGSRLEATIVDEWLQRHREAGEDVSIFTPPTIKHATCPVLLATADRVVVPEGRRAREVWQGCLEAKSVSAYRADQFGDEPDAIPEAYFIQTQVQLEVLGLDKAWLVALVGGNDWREYPQERDRELGGQLVEFVTKWWADHVVQGLPVQVDGSDAASAYLRRRFPAETLPLLHATPELADLVTTARLAKDRVAQAEDAEAAAVNALKAAIGDAAGIEGLVTFKANKPSLKVDWEQVAKQLHAPAELVTKFTSTKTGARVLRFSKA